uniref:Uncharacterized protein n=1 Tax=Oryza brachyantha TaxID=4533 RepID=J3N1N4_ORYBR
MPRRLPSSSPHWLLLLLVTAVMLSATEATAPVVPMELYFSPAELASIAGYGEEPVSTVVVSGQVVCLLSCRRHGADLLSFELPGSSRVSFVIGISSTDLFSFKDRKVTAVSVNKSRLL